MKLWSRDSGQKDLGPKDRAAGGDCCGCFGGGAEDGVVGSRGPLFTRKSSKATPEEKEAKKTQQAYGENAYVLVGQMGQGRTGTMKLMRNKKTKELVAAKWVERAAGMGLSKNTEREIVNHRRLLHPNIIRFKEVYMTDEHLVIVMEYASQGHLSQRIADNGPLPEDKARALFQQLISGMQYCHRQGIFHRDLRMENMLLDGQFFSPILKISGFGYSKSAILDSQPKTNVGSPAYTPPELLMAVRNEGAAYDGGSNDVWSAGVILFYMLTGELPFQDPAVPNALSRKMMQKIVNVMYEFPPNIALSPECKDFIARIFVADPTKRIKVGEMLGHPWLTGASLPNVGEEQESHQTELDIHDVVERARRRRKTELTNGVARVPSLGKPLVLEE